MKKKIAPKKSASSTSSRTKTKAAVKKVVVKASKKVEGADHWKKRKLDDKRKDWRNGGGNWIEEYVASKDHPHRELILEALKQFYPFAGILEVGCNAGPNLVRIAEVYPETQLAGVDVNADAVSYAREQVPSAMLSVGEASELPFMDSTFDIVIADAVLMYVSPEDIHQTLEEMDRVARRGIILVEWRDDNSHGKVVDGHWARNYGLLLGELGYDVEAIKLTEDQWPSENWTKNGWLYIAVRRQ